MYIFDKHLDFEFVIALSNKVGIALLILNFYAVSNSTKFSVFLLISVNAVVGLGLST